uniref:E3 ubiquitin-protein ligase E3D n=1 Tax=Geotrypetes seraphini TaxID=260995 RepID=A0A6P8QD53_GEOSA|nr:E3 ubiquitin-protein ligase E3D isoform X3 [Geotrypetes seraphini]
MSCYGGRGSAVLFFVARSCSFAIKNEIGIQHQLEEHLPVDILVSPTFLEVKAGEHCETINLPVGVRIAPSSCRGLRYVSGDGLQMRLQVQVNSSTNISNHSDEELPDLSAEESYGIPSDPPPPQTQFVPAWNSSLQAQKRCVFYCQSCGDNIMKESLCVDTCLKFSVTYVLWIPMTSVVFLRVLPLPNENWSSLVEEWCCHPNPFANRVLQPYHDDCFLGDTYLLVNANNESCMQETKGVQSESNHPTFTNCSILKSKENTTITCKRCKAILGERVSTETMKYYITEIMVQPAVNDIKMIPRCTFRFCLQGNDGKPYILLWLLNSDTLLVESARKSSSGNVFTLFDDNSTSNSRSLEASNAIKILYHPCIKFFNKELVDVWTNDIGVHMLTFPSKTCLELLVILTLRNGSLPPSLRCMNSFQVAFLRM